jgi:hypothetical protein
MDPMDHLNGDESLYVEAPLEAAMRDDIVRGEFTRVEIREAEAPSAPSPRDIRRDLRERLAIIDGRYADTIADHVAKHEALEREYRETIAVLEQERAALAQLLDIEEKRYGTLPAAIEAQKKRRLVPLADFLVTKVHAHGPMDKDQLRAEADLAGYFEDGNGRTFHTTLMNITNGGRLIRLSDGRYDFPNREPILFDAGGQDARPMN